MTVELIINPDPLDKITFKVGAGNLHGWPQEQPPQLAVRPVFFWATHISIAQIGELVSQASMVHCLLNDPDFEKATDVFDYLDELRGLLGTAGTLEVNLNSDTRTISNVFFSGIEPLIPAPLPNFVSTPAGPEGDFYTEVMLYFQKVKF